MPDTVREFVAYAIMGTVLFGAATFYLATRGRRQREALRRRGIKTYER